MPLGDPRGGGSVGAVTGGIGGSDTAVDAGNGDSPDSSTPVDECSPSVGDVELPAQWEGSAVGGRFGPSGSERVRLALPGSPHTQVDPETGELAGWVLFGRSPLRVGPASSDDCYLICSGEEPPRWHEGFVYPIRKDSATDAGIELEINLHEPWREWCQMQHPVARMDGSHTCATPDFSFDDPAFAVESPRCRDRLCSQLQVCQCSAGGCRMATDLVTIQLSRSGSNALVGMLDDMQVALIRPVGAPAPDGALPDSPSMDASTLMDAPSPPEVSDAGHDAAQNGDAGHDTASEDAP